ncbi:unnamed protein product [Colias eurytheme]|nr:unnamed protein product [Colias eurytheme]
MNLSFFVRVFKNNLKVTLKQKSYYCSGVAKITDLSIQNNSVLNSCSDDLSELAPNHPVSFNLAAYVNNSELLQNLIHLNVNLAKIEKKPFIVKKILKLNFDRDVKKHIFFLKDYVTAECIGEFITKNPLILCESIEDLEVRINYLQSKYFNLQQIKHIISKNPFWLMYSTIRIDKRLGFFQSSFGLTGREVRELATKQPRLITYNLHHIRTNTFVIKEEMGFTEAETKTIILNKPKLFMLNQRSLLERFNYIHNTIEIPHEIILKNLNVLEYRNFIVKQRHLFLKKLGRAQYNPTQENYVPITALCVDTDVEFCKKYAKSNVDDFNTFLKTL